MDENNEPIFSDVENEPTPYGLKDTPTSRSRKPKAGGELSKNTVIAFSVGVGFVVIAAAVGFLIVYYTPAPQTVSSIHTLATSTTPITSASPQTNPTITISVQNAGIGLRLVVRWNNLPRDTTKVDIFYSATKEGFYHMVGSVPVGPSSVGGGSGSLYIPNGYQNGYYYGVASGNDGAPLWSSSSTTPGNVPPQDSGSNNTGTASGTGGSENATTTPENGGQGENGTSTNIGTNTSTNASTGTGAPSGPGENFVVQHDDGKIQISWQSLPADTYQIVISRSASDNGPWVAVLTETNITTDGPYTLEVVDDTLGDPYYYRMDTYDANNTDIATFGPTFLAPL